MAATIIPITGRTPLPLELEQQSQKVVAHFQSLMSTDQTFKEEIERLISNNYLGFIYNNKSLGHLAWITPQYDCYPIFSDRVIARSPRTNKAWVWAVDVVKKKALALARVPEKHHSWIHPKAWKDYLLVTENEIGPKCFGFYATTRLLSDGLMDSVSYFLQPKYDQNLCEFINTHFKKDEKTLRSIANFLTVEMVFEVARLHEKNIVHRDLKVDNILIKRRKTGLPKVKLTDLEFSRPPGTSKKSAGSQECVSPQYAAELLFQKTFTVSVLNDAWALGSTILKLRACFRLNKHYDFIMNPSLSTPKVLRKIHHLLNTPDWIFKDEPKDPFEKVMWHLLCVSETERWTVIQAKDFIAPHAPEPFVID